MTTSSLQFGPEWMRKGPAKPTPSAAANSSTAPAKAAPPPASAGTGSAQAPSMAKRNPSLGSMNGPAPVVSPATVPSPGGFSFAAAAAGGKVDRSGVPGGSGSGAASGAGAGGGVSSAGGLAGVSSAGTAGAAALTGPAGAGSPGLLSLYSSKESSRGLLSPTSESLPPSSAETNTAPVVGTNQSASGGAQSRRRVSERMRGSQPKSKVMTTDRHFEFSATPTSSPQMFADREHQRRSTSTDASSALSPGGSSEPRGLNARGVANSAAPTDRERPGLFQRANSSTGKADTATSPTLPRERFGGIQGGVLSGVAPPERRRKESADFRSPRHPPPADEGTLWERRGGPPSSSNGSSNPAPEAFSSAGRFKSKPSLTGLGFSGGNTGGSESVESAKPTPTSSQPATPSWPARRRDRAPGEGPIGPPADGSAGFGRFAGYERKRERTASQADNWRAATAQSTTAPAANANGAQMDAPEAVSAALSSDHERASSSVSDRDALTIAPSDHVDEVTRSLASTSLEEPQEKSPPSNMGQPAAPEWKIEDQRWLYRDPSGQVQGPFPASTMQEWYEQRYFTDDLMIRPEQEEDFHPLFSLAAASGHDPKLFLLPPSQLLRPQPDQPAPEASPASFQQETPHHQMWDHQQHQQPAMGGGWPQQHQQQFGFGGPDLGMGGFASFGSPFAGHAGQQPGADLAFNHRFQVQDDYLAMIRQREREDQERQAAAAARGLSFGQLSASDNVGAWPSSQQIGQSQPWSSDAGRQAPQWGPSPGHQVRGQWEQLQQEFVERPEAVQPIGTPSASHGTLATEPQVEASPQIPSDHVQEVSQPAIVESVQEPAPLEPIRADSAPTVEEAEPRPATPQPEDPAPEHEWPQSPSAVEFATEPDLEELAAHERAESRIAAERKARAAGKPITQADTSAAAGNVKLVGPDHFRKGDASRSSSTSIQTPLSSLMPGSTPTPTSAKIAPWAQQNDDSASGTSAMSLREIQEAEAKKAEARRAAERAAAQRRNNTEAAGSRSTSETLPATMSWGLAGVPSSGSRGSLAGAPSTPTSAAPAWTASKTTPKKTLMEIQEEERKRSLALQAKNVQNIAARKAYADSTARPAPGPAASAAQPAAGWSVVGAGGKTMTPAPASAGVPARPPVAGPGGSATIQRTPSSTTPFTNASGGGAWGSGGAPVNGAKPNLATPAPRAVSGATTAAAKPSAPTSTNPSPEFLKYCKDQLKGLNVKVDDFIEMLLSFPLDPSPDVIELIAEQIYANSSTLDGRRLAQDFVAKRKMDMGISEGVGSRSASALGSASSAAASGAKANGSTGGVIGAGGASSSAAKAGGMAGFQQVVKKGAKRRA